MVKCATALYHDTLGLPWATRVHRSRSCRAFSTRWPLGDGALRATMLDATLNLGLGALELATSLTGPWRKDSWPARILFGAAAFNVAIGLGWFLA